MTAGGADDGHAGVTATGDRRPDTGGGIAA